MFKLIFIIFLMAIPIFGFSQNEIDTINQTNKNGNKTGYWINYYMNNKIESQGNFKIEENPDRIEELFMLGVKVSDTLKIKQLIDNKVLKTERSIKDGTWLYYDDNGNKIAVEEWINGFLKTRIKYYNDEKGVLYKTEQKFNDFFYGTKKDIKINNENFYLTGEKGNSKLIELIIQSNSKDELDLEISSKSNRITIVDKNIKIQPECIAKISIQYEFALQDYLDTVKVFFNNGENNNILVFIKSFGYDITSENLKKWNNKIDKIYIINSDKIVYYKTSNSCELKIYKFKNNIQYNDIKNGIENPLMIYPISYQKNVIDLNNLKNGKYLLREVDYQNNIDLFTMIEKKL